MLNYKNKQDMQFIFAKGLLGAMLFVAIAGYFFMFSNKANAQDPLAQSDEIYVWSGRDEEGMNWKVEEYKGYFKIITESLQGTRHSMKSDSFRCGSDQDSPGFNTTLNVFVGATHYLFSTVSYRGSSIMDGNVTVEAGNSESYLPLTDVKGSFCVINRDEDM